MSQGPSYRRQFPAGDPLGPTIEDIKRAKQLRNKTRFQTPYGFKEQKFGRKIWHRYPRTFVTVGTILGVGGFFAPFILRAFEQPTPEQLFLAERRKQRMIDAGIWYRPPSLFKGWTTEQKEEPEKSK
ncbi:uncharacterized protein LOC111716160 [Eurytemora carolleeae]|uniref:uncharacterized protein LOC111716160 n=1 Tax=Eurytemora carolleeae TaxID=1294199 RepID=UPI000C792D66|nr:uncharacterized protein LOC111716160 [Eurytemora carolleeae]|eukprot:XP_023347359.1 uncharacterized protein LOC111716160 [Eurytemora affinis]